MYSPVTESWMGDKVGWLFWGDIIQVLTPWSSAASILDFSFLGKNIFISSPSKSALNAEHTTGLIVMVEIFLSIFILNAIRDILWREGCLFSNTISPSR